MERSAFEQKARTWREKALNVSRRRTAESLEEATIVSLTSSPQEELEAKENEEWLIMKLQQLPTTQRTLLYMRRKRPVFWGAAVKTLLTQFLVLVKNGESGMVISK